MKPVWQTIVSNVNGNCMQATVASLLELQLDDVPKFIEQENPTQSFMDFMKSKGYSLITILYNDIDRPRVDKEYALSRLKEYEGIDGFFYGSVCSPLYYEEFGGTHGVVVNKDCDIVHPVNKNYEDMTVFPFIEGYNGLYSVDVYEKRKQVEFY